MPVAPTSDNDPRAKSGAKSAATSAKKDGSQGSAAWFAQQILNRIGAPTSTSNIQAMVSWMAAEGGHWNNHATFNPLNTTLPVKGDNGTMNSVGVRRYTSWEQGIEATAETLLGGKGRYKNIIAAFKQEQPANQIFQAVTTSPWGTHHIQTVTGHYGTSNVGGAKVGTPNQGDPTLGGTYSEDDLASTFGFSSAFFNTDPSLKALLNRAIAEKWYETDSGLALFKSSLKGTKWYQSHSSAEREWTQLQTSDPQELKARLDAQKADLQQQATQLGVTLSNGRLTELATNALKFGLNANEITAGLASEMKYQKKWDGNGMAGQVQDQLNQAAGAYGFKLSNSDAFKWTQSVLMNQKNSQFYIDQMKNAAKATFPGMSKMLDQGMTVKDIASPYMQAMGQLLEIDPDNIDFTKDKSLLQAFQWKDPNAKNATGNDPNLMPIWQFQDQLRKDPRWMQTDNARNSFMDTGMGVLRNMGLVV